MAAGIDHFGAIGAGAGGRVVAAGWWRPGGGVFGMGSSAWRHGRDVDGVA
ncbi:hypothetical protein [Streptomyces echinatus]